MMEEISEIVQGKKKIIIHRHASGESKVIEAMQVILGPGWHYVGDQEEEINKLKSDINKNG